MTSHIPSVPPPTPKAPTKPCLVAAGLGVRRPKLKVSELLPSTLELGHVVALALGLSFLT